ncbi:MAG: DUF805 domain-containing protein [Hyphomonas sp.]
MSFADVLFKPNGRIEAGQFWAGWAVLVVTNIILNFIPILNILGYFVLIYVGVCVYGKRLHDMGRTAWIVAIPWGLGFILGIIGFFQAAPAIMEVYESDPQSLEDPMLAFEVMRPFFINVGLGMLVWLGLTIWVGTGKSDPNENQYGPGPGGSVSADPFT